MATEVVNTNGGKHSFIIPSSLPAGEYLIRGEIIALHVAQSYPGAQFYIGCAQVKIVRASARNAKQRTHILDRPGGGSVNPPKVALPGAYQGSDPGITVNFQSYPPPGLAVWSG